MERIQDPYLSISCHFYLILFLSISCPFLSNFYLFVSISIRSYPLHILACDPNIPSKKNTMIRCSQPRNAKAKQHFESFRPILECRPTHRGLFEVGQNEMEACFLEPPCQPAISAIVSCQRKNNVASVEKQSSIVLITFNHSMTLSSGTACDTVLRASLLSPPELWHVAANSMHHGTCSFT